MRRPGRPLGLTPRSPHGIRHAARLGEQGRALQEHWERAAWRLDDRARWARPPWPGPADSWRVLRHRLGNLLFETFVARLRRRTGA